jgi:glycosyltransferase involved in cell wall biosynthesis
MYVVELVRALAAAGAVDLSLVARRHDDARWRALAPAAEVAAVAPGQRPLRLAWEQAWPLASAARSGRAVWHGPHYTLPLLLRGPKVVTVHDLTFFDNPEWHERAKVAYFTRMIRASSSRADAIVCVSDRTAARLRDLLAPTAPVSAIPHGVDHGRFAPEGAGGPDGDLELLAALGIRPPFVVFCGTLEPRKAVPGLVRAFSAVAPGHPELTLVLAGRPGWGAQEVDAAVAASGLAERIVRTGYVADDVVPALLRSSSAAVYAPFAEGFGLPALEALACGAALVTTAATPMADLAADAALAVPPGDEGALAEAIEATVAGGPEVADRRARGPALAAPWTWARCAASHAEVYRTALSR